MKFENCLYKDICENECKKACLRYTEMSYLLKHSNIPKAKQKINRLEPEDCDMKAFETLANIRDNIVEFTDRGNSLYIYSNTCGNGKTTWSIKLLLQYFNEMWAGNGFVKRGVFISVPTFLYQCKENISRPTIEFEILKQDLMNVDLVVWDDISATRLSEYDYSLLFAILDNRILSSKANIFTGNVKPENLKSTLGDRLASRILESITIELKGGDRRGNITNYK